MSAMRLTSALAIAGCLGACASYDEQTAPVRRATLTLDHAWIATVAGAPAERKALEHAGFRIAPTINRHDGQGTASATVEFENGFLELIWADDSVPVTGGGAIAKQRFTERADWRKTGSSPFGVALNPHGRHARAISVRNLAASPPTGCSRGRSWKC